jgi:hypothetical protein
MRLAFQRRPLAPAYGTPDDDGPTGQPLAYTDFFGWHRETFQPSNPLHDPFEYTDTVNQTHWSSQDNTDHVPQVEVIGPVRGQTWDSPWFGNTVANFTMQVSQLPAHAGPVRGGISSDITWLQYLAASEVPDSTIAQEVFAGVKAFPYAFRRPNIGGQ